MIQRLVKLYKLLFGSCLSKSVFFGRRKVKEGHLNRLIRSSKMRKPYSEKANGGSVPEFIKQPTGSFINNLCRRCGCRQNTLVRYAAEGSILDLCAYHTGEFCGRTESAGNGFGKRQKDFIGRFFGKHIGGQG